MHDADDGHAVGEVVEYCRTQADLLAGRVETMAAEAEALVDEIDEGVADLRAALDERESAVGDDAGTADGGGGADDAGGHGGEVATDEPDAGGTGAADDVSDLVDAESDLREKRAAVEATETRMRLFQDLAADYLDLADDLLAAHEAGDLDADDAVRRVVSFEADRDAPAYFEERETLVETARRGTTRGDGSTGDAGSPGPDAGE